MFSAFHARMAALRIGSPRSPTIRDARLTTTSRPTSSVVIR
jgi:hypothetical protein